MYIGSTKTLSLRSGFTAGCAGGSGEIVQRGALEYVYPRIEDALNTRLVHASVTDIFTVDTTRCGESLRLSRGFVNLQSVVVELGRGETTQAFSVDAELGTLSFTSCIRGTVAVKYTAGFAVSTDPADGDKLLATPDWLDELSYTMAMHYLNTLTTNAITRDKGRPLPDVDAILQREVCRRVYSRYHRPRASVVWPTRSYEDV